MLRADIYVFIVTIRLDSNGQWTWRVPNERKRRLLGVPFIVEGQAAAQQLVGHNACCPHIGGRHHFTTENFRRHKPARKHHITTWRTHIWDMVRLLPPLPPCELIGNGSQRIEGHVISSCQGGDMLYGGFKGPWMWIQVQRQYAHVFPGL